MSGVWCTLSASAVALQGTPWQASQDGADGRWRARYRDPAGREHARHFDRKVDAQRWLDSVTTAVGTGTYVDPRRAKATVGELAPVWLAGKINLKPTSRAR
ncbi:hypothetical protein SAMN05661080_02802 [Modestobacter sp. DSM 44400]|nr:hypothetical protein SAMN05661080_02802 [Modestobacter sp. DSM 44400]